MACGIGVAAAVIATIAISAVPAAALPVRAAAGAHSDARPVGQRATQFQREGGSVVAASLGVDVSIAVTEEQFECLSGAYKAEYAIVRAYRSIGAPDEAAPATISAAATAGLRTAIYHFPNTSQPAVQQVQASLDALRQAGVDPSSLTEPVQLWLDIERFRWPDDPVSNTQFIVDMFNAGTSAGLRVGVYSGRYSWPAITGNSSALSALKAPLWYAHYQSPPQLNFDDYYGWGTYGGWSQPYMKQYAGDDTDCGVDVDLNWRPE